MQTKNIAKQLFFIIYYMVIIFNLSASIRPKIIDIYDYKSAAFSLHEQFSVLSNLKFVK